MRGVAVLASLAALLAAPATASAGGFYDCRRPGATAPDGHDVVSIAWTIPTLQDRFASGHVIGVFNCQWSDGTTNKCEGLAE